MHPAIQLLKTDYKLPIDVATENGHQTSLLRVVQEVCDIELTDEQFIVETSRLTNISRIVMDEPTIRGVKHLPKYLFRYCVQNFVKAYVGHEDMDQVTIFNKSYEQARKYIQNNPWVFATGEDPNAPPKLDANGNIQPKKGDKKVMAKKLYDERKSQNLTRKEWIELLVKEVGLTPAGASTYYSNLKSGLY